MKPPRPYFVGISGGSGSGKTTLLRRIVERFGNETITLISQDNYYISLENLPRSLNGDVNFDHPSALNLEALALDLGKLEVGQGFSLEEYTFNNASIVPKVLAFAPAPIVVIEGLFVFNHPEVNSKLDLRIFVDTSEHLRLARRIRRDAEERGYGLEEVLGYYEKFVVPMYRQFIEPYRAECDIVIPNDRHMDRASAVLIHHLEAVLTTLQ